MLVVPVGSHDESSLKGRATVKYSLNGSKGELYVVPSLAFCPSGLGPTDKTGGVKSKATDSTVMLKLALPVFPAESVEVHVTVVVPSYHLLPAKFRDEGLKVVTSR